MSNLLDKGVVYLDTLESHRNREGDQEREDANEGTVQIRQLRGAVLRMQDPGTGKYEKVAHITEGVGKFGSSRANMINVFCAFYCEVEAGKQLQLGDVIDPRVINGFGSSAVLIYKPREFIEKVKIAANKKGLFFESQKVSYVDFSSYDGEVGPFVKSLRFQHQNEFRVVVGGKGAPGKAFSLEIGSIREFATLQRADDVSKMVFKLD